MADWAREIMVLANDFCLNMAKVKEIVTEVENVTVSLNEQKKDADKQDTDKQDVEEKPAKKKRGRPKGSKRNTKQ